MFKNENVKACVPFDTTKDSNLLIDQSEQRNPFVLIGQSNDSKILVFLNIFVYLYVSLSMI